MMEENLQDIVAALEDIKILLVLLCVLVFVSWRTGK